MADKYIPKRVGKRAIRGHGTAAARRKEAAFKQKVMSEATWKQKHYVSKNAEGKSTTHMNWATHQHARMHKRTRIR